MKKPLKISLLFSACCVGTGIVVGFIGYAMNNFSFDLPGELRFHKVSSDVSNDFDKIHIYDVNNSVELLPSEDGKCYIECYDSKKVSHDINVENDVLTIDLVDSRQWYEMLSFSELEKNKLTVYIPQKEYGEISIKTVNGSISADEDLKLNNLYAESTNGSLSLDAQLNGNIDLRTVNGDIESKGINFAGIISAESTNGNISILGENASELYTKTVNGSITAKIEVKEIAQLDTVNGDIFIDGLRAGKYDTHTVNGNVYGKSKQNKET